MQFIIIFVLITFKINLFYTNEIISTGNMTIPLSRRIVGGREAIDGSFPYMAAIVENEYLCGGAIISDEWILTAAHCFEKINIENLKVIVGSIRRNSRKVVKMDVELFVMHPKYGALTVDPHDIGLIKTKNLIKFGDRIQRIRLATDTLDGIYHVIIPSWGQTKLGSPPAHTLRFLRAKTITNRQCKNTFRDIAPEHICILSPPGQDTCFGDSGSPLIYQHRIYGVVSTGIRCGVGQPEIFVDVSSHLNWIMRISGVSV